jgi:hypothetical protein
MLAYAMRTNLCLGEQEDYFMDKEQKDNHFLVRGSTPVHYISMQAIIVGGSIKCNASIFDVHVTTTNSNKIQRFQCRRKNNSAACSQDRRRPNWHTSKITVRGSAKRRARQAEQPGFLCLIFSRTSSSIAAGFLLMLSKQST